jgi:hypothetical protein
MTWKKVFRISWILQEVVRLIKTISVPLIFCDIFQLTWCFVEFIVARKPPTIRDSPIRVSLNAIEEKILLQIGSYVCSVGIINTLSPYGAKWAIWASIITKTFRTFFIVNELHWQTLVLLKFKQFLSFWFLNKLFALKKTKMLKFSTFCSAMLKSPQIARFTCNSKEHNIQVWVLQNTLSTLLSNYCFNWRSARDHLTKLDKFHLIMT